jgi:tRNA pseudouridine55 synthase
MGRRKGQPIDGVLLLDKPSGVSSNTALQRARRSLGAAKAGHTGTLDPMASGLLPVAFGEATKFSQYLLDADKVYLAEMRLGIITDTGDAEGRVVATSDYRPSANEILAACRRFVGELDQIPPLYSALKRDGKALYEYARSGMDVERQPRRVTIHAIEVMATDTDWFRCRVRCSKGTYIRSLAEDLGEALGCGAHLSALIREGSGSFVLADAVPLGVFEHLPQDRRMEWLLPLDTFVWHLPSLSLSHGEAGRIVHGQGTGVADSQASGIHRLYLGGQFLGLGNMNASGMLVPLRLVAAARLP